MRVHISRAWAFGRHIPPQKIVRRVMLGAHHKLRDWRGAFVPPASSVKLSRILPEPVFDQRKGALKRNGKKLTFTFIGCSVTFSDGEVDWTAPGSGTGSQLWRMNLAYMEYLEGVDDVLFADLVKQWLAANTEVQPGAWRDGWNAYALSIRVVVWLQELSRRRESLETSVIEKVAESAARQLNYLVRHLETDIGGNHLIKNIKALLWGAAAFEGADAKRWEALGRRLLERELAIQVLPDGVHYERSPAYHAQVMADLLEIRSVLVDPMPALDTALASMAQAVADLVHPDGFCAQFNDAGLCMAYAPGDCLDAFAKQGFTRPSQRKCFAFTEAGYFGWRDDRLTLIVDCGPIAPDDLPAHGHADVLSFELSVDGRRIFVDQGVYEYVAGERRALSRSAAAHNTLTIQGADQADFFGAFRMGRRPHVSLTSWSGNSQGILLEGEHDGFSHLPGTPRHQRRIEARAEGIFLQDRIKGIIHRQAHVALLLHPRIEAKRLDERTFLLVAADTTRLRLHVTAPLLAEPAVWWPDMGVEHATIRLVAKLKGTGGIETQITLAAAA